MPTDDGGPPEPKPVKTGAPRNGYGLTYGGGPSLTLTEAKAATICAAAKTHPSVKTAAHACGVPVRTLREWLRRGAMPGAHPTLSAFATDFMAAIAEHARTKFSEFESACRDGHPSAGVLLKYIDRRFSDTDNDIVENAISGGAKRSDNIEDLLLNPTPRLRGLLAKTGWVRAEDWNHPGVVQTTGEPTKESE